MADIDDDDDDAVKELYELKPCRYCKTDFPAISLCQHEELCKLLFNQAHEIDCDELAGIYEAGLGDGLNYDDPADEEENEDAYVDTPCRICEKMFPRLTINSHEALCQMFIEQYAAAAEFERKNSENNCSVSDVKEKSEDLPKAKNNSKEKQEIKIEPQKIFIKTEVFKSKEQKEGFQSQSFSPNKVESENSEETKKVPIFKEQIKNENFQSQSFSSNKTKQDKEFTAKESEFDDAFMNEKRVPNVPKISLLDCIDQTDDTADLNNLSDDDCDESLEDFWNRAREFLQRRRQQNF